MATEARLAVLKLIDMYSVWQIWIHCNSSWFSGIYCWMK